MPFCLDTGFDQHHTCPAGPGADHPTDLDPQTWTCRVCQQPVLIEMADHAGHRYTVERVPARTIRVGDCIVYRERAGISAGEVLGSGPQPGAADQWDLIVARLGLGRIAAAQYISRILG